MNDAAEIPDNPVPEAGSEAAAPEPVPEPSEPTPEEQSVSKAAAAFANQSKEEILGAREVKIPFDLKGGHVPWKVLAAGEEMEKDCRPREEAPDPGELPFIDLSKPLDQLFFETSFGDFLQSTGAIMKTMLRKHHATYRKHHKESNALTDEEVKKGMLILLAASGETAVSVENL